MTTLVNLPACQRRVQGLVDQFNADEMFWRSLDERRKNRRKLLRRLSKKQHHQLDIWEFELKRTPGDCVAA